MFQVPQFSKPKVTLDDNLGILNQAMSHLERAGIISKHDEPEQTTKANNETDIVDIIDILLERKSNDNV